MKKAIDLEEFPYVKKRFRAKYLGLLVCACQHCDNEVKISSQNTAVVGDEVKTDLLTSDTCLKENVIYFCNKCGQTSNFEFEWRLTIPLKELEEYYRAGR